jgi:hypothetical protein
MFDLVEKKRKKLSTKKNKKSKKNKQKKRGGRGFYEVRFGGKKRTNITFPPPKSK